MFQNALINVLQENDIQEVQDYGLLLSNMVYKLNKMF